MNARLDFLMELARRRIVERYVGTALRMLWVLLSALIPLLMNLAVFYYIARIPEVQTMGVAGYAAFIFSGLLPFRFVQKSATESCDLLLANMEMLRSVNFPLPLLSLASTVALLVEFAVQCVLMAALVGIAGHTPGWSILLFPFALASLVMLALGASWLMSVAGYVLRDLQEVMTVVFAALVYVTPTMYPPEAAPAFLQRLIWLNPLTHYVLTFRDAILPAAAGPHWSSWVVVAVLPAVVLACGYAAIARVRRYVGDMV